MPVIESDKLLADIQAGKLAPVYFLHGEEEYYIDRVSSLIEEKALQPSEKDFNQHILFGKDQSMASVLQTARKFPMFAERQLVIVKEAQELKDLTKEVGEKLMLNYLDSPLPSTILVFCHKLKSLDKRKALYKALDKKAIVMNSMPVPDYKLGKWIQSEIESSGYKVKPEVAQLMAEFIGNDLHRVVNELKKIKENLPKKGETITEELVEKYVGVSREYNVFELQKAIGFKDAEKTYRIVAYFESNPKNHPLVMTVTSLFNYFVKVIKTHANKDKGEGHLAGVLGVNPFFVKEYTAAAKMYPYPKCVRIIEYIRQTDLVSKGFGSPSVNDAYILKELVHKIFHA
jgi:DNA polymerase III subunit delta